MKRRLLFVAIILSLIVLTLFNTYTPTRTGTIPFTPTAWSYLPFVAKNSTPTPRPAVEILSANWKKPYCLSSDCYNTIWGEVRNKSAGPVELVEIVALSTSNNETSTYVDGAVLGAGMRSTYKLSVKFDNPGFIYACPDTQSGLQSISIESYYPANYSPTLLELVTAESYYTDDATVFHVEGIARNTTDAQLGPVRAFLTVYGANGEILGSQHDAAVCRAGASYQFSRSAIRMGRL